MAQKEGFNLIIIGITASWLIAAPAFAVTSKSEAQKYPPISGEIYGQAAPGVKSITVNNKPVPFDKDFNFKTTVNLKAGEKYLTLKINYSGLRIIKRYLILRKGPSKKFEVHVPKEKIIKSTAAAAKPAEKPMEVSLPTEQVTPAETLASHPTATMFEKAKTTVEEAITSTTVSPTSTALLPQGTTTEETLEIKEIKEKVAAKPKKKAALSHRHPKKFVKKKIIKLAKRPAAPPKKIKPAIVKRKPCNYRYVWEFSRGKLLLVREQKGFYSAQIHIPSTKQWIDIKDISSKDLKEIMLK